jgi:hypothetical protein
VLSEQLRKLPAVRHYNAEYYSYYGYFPDNVEQHGVKTKGEYTTHITIDNGAMTATLASLHQDVNGLSLSLRPALAENDLPKVITKLIYHATI